MSIDVDGAAQAAEDKKLKEMMENQVQTIFHFPTAIYTINKPEYLPMTKKVTSAFLKKRKKQVKQLDEIYPAYMTEDLRSDERMSEFSMYIANTAWNILQSQGYAMDNLNTFFTELWCQEHYKHSSMEQHIHGFGIQIVGFYFIDCPENSSKVVFHDPKPAKVQAGLPEQSMEQASYASNMINFEPKPGMLMFTNAWLPHSFTRHGSDKPMRFIHFNLTVGQAPATPVCATPAEVI